MALGLLDREGDGPEAQYRNTANTAYFLDKSQPAYLGGILEMANARLYGFWDNLTEALMTGAPQNEAKVGGNFFALLDKIDFASATTLCDVGGANGTLCGLAAQRYPNLSATLFDLPPVVPVAQRHLEAMGVGARVNVVRGDFFADELPEADIIVMGIILHDWDEA